MAITYRNGLGRPLTESEIDTNFRDVDEHPDGIKIPATDPGASDVGLLLDPSAPAYGWHDLRAYLVKDESAGPVQSAFINGVKALQFTAEDTQSAYANFHIPHDYVPGTDIFIHVHWAVDSTTVTGGSVTWGFETTYARGHQQQAFATTKTVSILQNASTTQYYHMVAEGALSVSGGSGTQLDTDDIEVDGVIATRLYLDSNDITDSVTVPNPFAFFVDVHYQSSGTPTLNKAPSFYGT